MSLPRISIRRPVSVAMLFLAIVLLGAISFLRLPIDLLPDVAYPKLVVHTSEVGAAPAEVERFLTEPVEQAVSSVPGVQEVESVSRQGLSLVTLRFAWGTDMDFAALGVREKLDAIADVLPEMATRPTVLRMDPRSEPIMALSVAGPDLPSLKELAESVFKRRLEQIDGVAQAAVTGGLEREIQVEIDPRRLEAYRITLTDVTSALSSANASAPGGTIRSGRYRYSLRTLGELQTVDQIGEVAIYPSDAGSQDSTTPATAGLRVRDVATVTDGFRERETIARYNGDESVGLLIFKSAGANTVGVAESVEETLIVLRRQYPSVELEVATSQAGFVSQAIDNVVQNLVQGAFLAFLVLLLFLRDVRYPVAIGLAIPISVIATFSLLDAFGVSLNIMSLGGLALGVGMLVDNSIVVLENTSRHRERGSDAATAAADGAEEVQGAITASTLTTIAVFGPIVYVEGVAGEFFGALSLAVAFSLLASLLVALTLLPTMAARWGYALPERTGLRRRAQQVTGRFFAPVLNAFDRGFARFAARYGRTLAWALDHRSIVMTSSVLLLGVGIAVALALDRRVLPEVDQGEFTAKLVLARGTPLERTAEEARRLEAIFLADTDVQSVFTQVGRRTVVAGIEQEESGLNTATVEVRLNEGASTDEVLARVRPMLGSLPPGVLAIETGDATAIGQMMGGGEADLAVRIRGADADAAFAYAQQVEERLAGTGSMKNVRLGTEIGQPEIRLEIDRARAASYGIDPRTIADAITGYMYGDVATEFVDFDRKIPVVVRLPDNARHSLETLQTLEIQGIPIRELVTMETAFAPAEIRRTGQSRVVAVYADIANGGLEEALSETRAALRELPPVPGLRVEVGGENEEMQRSFRELAFAFSLALLLVYMILAAEFESLLHPFIILLSVPMGLVGAFLALWITGAGLNTMSLIGIIILAGIVDNDAVVKVDFINQMRRRGMPMREAILAAGHARMRPILMTTVTTMLGLLPMAVAVGRGAGLRAPLAVAIFGGLFSATALTLIVIPVVYDLMEEGRERLGALLGHSVGRTPAPEPVAE